MPPETVPMETGTNSEGKELTDEENFSNAKDRALDEDKPSEKPEGDKSKVDKPDGSKPEGEPVPDSGKEPEGAPGAEEPPAISELRTQLAETKGQLETLTKQANQTQAAEEVRRREESKEITPEKWTQYETAWGYERIPDESGNETLRIDPRKQMQAIATRISNASKLVLDEAKKEIDNQMADYKRESVYTSMENNGFADIRKHKEGIDEYLKTYVPDVRKHSDPKIIEAAYYYNRGKKAPEDIKNATQSRVVNKRVRSTSTPTRPATDEKGASELSSLERNLMEMDGTCASEKEWRAFRGRKN